MSIKTRLSGFTAKNFTSLLREHGARIGSQHAFFPNEVEPAKALVCRLRDGQRSVLVAQPMQSGKTNIISAATLILRAFVPNLRAVYICANDQLDFRRQNKLALAPHVEVLTRKDRRTWADEPAAGPLIVFYDESHFGDGTDMTVSQFLTEHKVLDNPDAVFCGVSATPFTSVGCLESTIWPDMEALDAAGYNSPGRMLNEGRIRDADKMFWAPSRKELGRSPMPSEVKVLEECEAYIHLMGLLDAPPATREGYVMIRCRRWEGDALEAHLTERWADSVYVEKWNQHNRDFSPREFFEKRRPGVVTVVLVQHKARMGNVIATKHCHFFYEYSPKACVDTIAQSFIGRACGFGKQEHAAIVYSRREVARAYDILISSNGDTALFAIYCGREDLQPSSRSILKHGAPRHALEEIKSFKVPANANKLAIRRQCNVIRKHFGLESGRGSIRTMSNTADPIKRGMVDQTGKRARSQAAVTNCGPFPGDWSIIVFDVKSSTTRRSKPSVHERVIQVAMRGRRIVAGLPELFPSHNTLHYALKNKTAGLRQMRLNLERAPLSKAL